MKNKKLLVNIAVLVVALAIALVAGADFRKMHEPDKIYTGNPAITSVKKLSDYNNNLLNTAGDTDIYVLDSGVPGGKALIYGGTHSNETAAVMNALTYIENAVVEQGTLYVIFQANQSAFTNTLPLRAQMSHMNFTLPDGSVRSVRMGSRLANPVHQWPDPNYRLNSSGRVLKQNEIAEIRNLNRNHPGMEEGYLVEMVAYGIRNLIDTEGIDFIFDGHEASPEFLRVNYLIAHDRAMNLGSTAILNASLDAMMEGNMEGYPFKLDLSGATSWGLSHRALGDNTATLATLFESLNPVMGFCHGKVNEELVKEGKSDNYVKITDMGLLDSGELTDAGSPIELRTAYHMEISRQLLNAMGELDPAKTVTVTGLPTFTEMVSNGLESTLKPLE
jgi:hypothetical protein